MVKQASIVKRIYIIIIQYILLYLKFVTFIFRFELICQLKLINFELTHLYVCHLLTS